MIETPIRPLAMDKEPCNSMRDHPLPANVDLTIAVWVNAPSHITG